MRRIRLFISLSVLSVIIGCASAQRANLYIEPINSLGQSVTFVDGTKYITHQRQDLGLNSTLSILSFSGKVPSIALFKLALRNTTQESITVSIDEIYTFTEETLFQPVVNVEDFLETVRRGQSYDRLMVTLEQTSIGLERSQPATPSVARTSTSGSIRNGNVDLDSTTTMPNPDAERIRSDNLNQRELANQRRKRLLDQELESAYSNYFKTHTLEPGEIYEKSFAIDLNRDVIGAALSDVNYPILLAARFNNSSVDGITEPMWWEIYITAN